MTRIRFCPRTTAALGTAVLILSFQALSAEETGSQNHQSTQVANSTSIEAPAATADTYSCTPTEVGVFTNRVHVRCSAAAPGGIYWFAVATSNGANANRFLSIFTTALTTGRTLTIFYTASDTSGNAWGCNAGDCRTATGATMN